MAGGLGEKRERRDRRAWNFNGKQNCMWKRVGAVPKLSLPMGQVKGQGLDTHTGILVGEQR